MLITISIKFRYKIITNINKVEGLDYLSISINVSRCRENIG